LSKVDMTKLCW